MKKVLGFILVIVIASGMAGVAVAIPINYVENVSGLDNEWSDLEIYTFLGGGIALAAGTYSLTFNLNGIVWSTPSATAHGWEPNDAIYIEALLNGVSIGSIPPHNGMDGQYQSFSLSLDLDFELLTPSTLAINSWSDVSYGGELWEVNSASLMGSYSPVPEPATIFLLSSGLIGLAGFRKKLKKMQSNQVRRKEAR